MFFIILVTSSVVVDVLLLLFLFFLLFFLIILFIYLFYININIIIASSVVVHGTTGKDATLQVTSLSVLLMDSHSRTIRGLDQSVCLFVFIVIATSLACIHHI